MKNGNVGVVFLGTDLGSFGGLFCVDLLLFRGRFEWRFQVGFGWGLVTAFSEENRLFWGCFEGVSCG